MSSASEGQNTTRGFSRGPGGEGSRDFSIQQDQPWHSCHAAGPSRGLGTPKLCCHHPAALTGSGDTPVLLPPPPALTGSGDTKALLSPPPALTGFGHTPVLLSPPPALPVTSLQPPLSPFGHGTAATLCTALHRIWGHQSSAATILQPFLSPPSSPPCHPFCHITLPSLLQPLL